jgi:hypothetical protein
MMKYSKFSDVTLIIKDILPSVELVYGEQSARRNQTLLSLAKAFKELGQHEEACSAA